MYSYMFDGCDIICAFSWFCLPWRPRVCWIGTQCEKNWRSFDLCHSQLTSPWVSKDVAFYAVLFYQSDSGVRALGLNPWARHITLALPLWTQGVQTDTSKFTARGKTAMDSHPIQGGEEMLRVVSCPRNRDKLRPDRPLGSYADLYLTLFYQMWY